MLPDHANSFGPAGVCIDPDTGLMWQTRDNGYAVVQAEAAIFARNTRVGGFRDWRLPTIAELKSVYHIGDNDFACRIKGNIWLTGVCQWSSEAGLFLDFNSGESVQDRDYYYVRVLCVRPAGK